jgi:hypothetical protein
MIEFLVKSSMSSALTWWTLIAALPSFTAFEINIEPFRGTRIRLAKAQRRGALETNRGSHDPRRKLVTQGK